MPPPMNTTAIRKNTKEDVKINMENPSAHTINASKIKLGRPMISDNLPAGGWINVSTT